MDISPKVLRKETVKTLKEVEEDLTRLSPLKPPPLETATLLLAKAQCLNTLTILRGQ